MNLTEYIDFTAQFDLTGYPKLVLTDKGTYPADIGEIKIAFRLKQPDGIITQAERIDPGGSVEFILRLDGSGKPACGDYKIYVYAINDNDLSDDVERTVAFQYKKATLNLVEDFDVFTPKLLYRDKTDYDKIGYTVIDDTIVWVALVGDAGSIGTINGSTSILDLNYNGSYYSTEYEISFSRELVYESDSQPWLTIKDKYTSEIETEASEPPTIDQLFESLELLLLKQVEGTCGCKTTMQDYLYAQSLLSHLLLLIQNGQTGTGGDVVLQQFINITQNITQNITNNVMYEFNYTTVGGSTGETTATLDIDVSGPITEFTTASLINKTIERIEVDGIGRKFVEGLDTGVPADGTFVFVKATGKWIYGGELQDLQWIQIKYKL